MKALAFVIASLPVLAVAPVVRAQGAPPAAPAVSAAPEEPSWFVPEGTRVKNVAFEGNPLGIVIGRFSANVEYTIAPHHVLVLSPHYYFALPGVDDQLDGLGAEAGYRYYTGEGGPVGWFVGGSLSFGSYRYRHTADNTIFSDPACAGASPPAGVRCVVIDQSVDNSWQSLGGALDAGYQILFQDRLVIGGGIGVEYRYYTSSPGFEYVSHPRHDLFYGPGFRPRILVAAGAAF